MNIQHPVRGRVEEFRVQLAWRSCIEQALDFETLNELKRHRVVVTWNDIKRDKSIAAGRLTGGGLQRQLELTPGSPFPDV